MNLYSIFRNARYLAREKLFGEQRLRTAGSLLLAGSLTASSVMAGPSVYPTGTTVYDPAKAYNSYVLFTGGDNTARLIDLNGNVVRQWKDAAAHSTAIDPALNGGRKGHVFVTLALVEGQGTGLVPGRPNARKVQSVGELDWNGKLVWSFGEKAPGGAAQQHHDWARLRNGNTVILANLEHKVEGFQQALLDDVIYEINPAGEVVWRWVAAEHLNEFGFTPEQLQLVRATPDPDYLHFNNLKVVGPNRWFNAGDKRFHPDNLVIDARNANFIAIIDRQSSKVVWRLGPNYAAVKPEDRRKLPRPVDQIAGQHDAHIIPEGLPGAGNLLVFDNQGQAGYPPAVLPITGGSRVLEIDPVKQQIVWQYTGEDSGGSGWTFRSTHISAARRLPNGNTFIDEGQSGRLFQVTPAGDIVWEYVNPFPGVRKDPATNKNIVNRQLYRGQPVPYDWVPEGTPRSEKPVRPPVLEQFNLSASF